MNITHIVITRGGASFTMAQISDLLEFLRSKEVSSEDLSSTLRKLPDDVIELRLSNLNEMKNRLTSNLKVNYWDEITLLIDGVFKNRSKYNYITDGVDFLGHIRTRTNLTIYNYIAELFAIQEIMSSLQAEKRKRVNYTELNIDDLMEESCDEYKKCKRRRSKKAKYINDQYNINNPVVNFFNMWGRNAT